jgi:hypothetical protein
MLHPSEVGKGKDLDYVQEIPDIGDDRIVPIHGTITNQEKSPPVFPKTLTVEDSNIVLGYGEHVSSDHSLERIISALVPSYSETSSPTLIPTYLGKEVVVRTISIGHHRAPSGDGIVLGKDHAWSWGLGYEFSPIKTRSARKKAGTNDSYTAKKNPSNLEQGALRGMESLARAKP